MRRFKEKLRRKSKGREVKKINQLEWSVVMYFVNNNYNSVNFAKLTKRQKTICEVYIFFTGR